MAKTAVVALGGNALTREGQAGTYEEMEANANVMARSIASLMRAGWRVVVVHGNGPQVGMLALESAADPALSKPTATVALSTRARSARRSHTSSGSRRERTW